MKKSVLIALLFLACISSCKRKPEDVVADASKKYAAINEKLKDYTYKRVDDITAPGAGTITGYYREEEVKKVYGEHYTDTARTFTEYYFDDGMLIYIMKQDFKYNRPASYTEEKAKAQNDSVWYDDKKTRMEVTRFYFDKNKLVKWIAPGNHDVSRTEGDFLDMESRLWAETVILIKELK